MNGMCIFVADFQHVVHNFTATGVEQGHVWVQGVPLRFYLGRSRESMLRRYRQAVCTRIAKDPLISPPFLRKW